MSAQTAARPQAGKPLRWLADAYARYAHLVLAQLQALDDGDIDRIESLASERDALAREIDGAQPAATRAGPSGDIAVEQVRQAIARAAEADARLRSRLAQLRSETREAIGEAERAAERVADVARSYGPPSAPGARIDVSL